MALVPVINMATDRLQSPLEGGQQDGNCSCLLTLPQSPNFFFLLMQSYVLHRSRLRLRKGNQIGLIYVNCLRCRHGGQDASPGACCPQSAWRPESP